MVQGPAGVTRKNTVVHCNNSWVHQNETYNSGVHDNAGVQANMDALHNDYHNTQICPIIKIENTTDATEEDKN